MQHFQQLVAESVTAAQQTVVCRHLTARYITRLHHFYDAVCKSASASEAIESEKAGGVLSMLQSNVDHISDVFNVPIYEWAERIRDFFNNAQKLSCFYPTMITYISLYNMPVCPHEVNNLFLDQIDLIRDYYEASAELQSCINSTNDPEYIELLDVLLSQQLHFPAVRQISADEVHIYHGISEVEGEEEEESNEKERGMGTGYVATMQGIPLLLKKVKTSSLVPSNMLRLVEFAFTMQYQHLSSPYIIPSLHTYLATDKIGYLTELAPFGSLTAFLTNPPEHFTNDDDVAVIPPYIRALIMLDVCSGLQYLHSKSIVHGRLKPSNVLIFDNYRARISDFGVSHLMSSDFAYLGVCFDTYLVICIGTGGVRWYPPEFFSGVPASDSSKSIFQSSTHAASPPFPSTFQVFCLVVLIC